MKRICYKIKFWLIGLWVRLTKYTETRRGIWRVFRSIAFSYHNRGHYGSFLDKRDADIAEKILNEMGVLYDRKFDGVFHKFEVGGNGTQ